MFAHEAVAWLLTYLLHSTLLLGLAWLVSKPLARWSVAAEEAVWKLALVGALVTASLQIAAGWEPAAGRLTLAGPAPQAAMAPAASQAETPAAPFRMERSPRALPAASEIEPASRPVLLSPPAAALGLWSLGAAFLLAAYGWSYFRVTRRLRARPRVVGGTLLTQLQALSQEAGIDGPVRLSCSWRVPVPLALGLRRSEICVPPRALAALSAEQQEGMLAHELAHLVRRDPVWLVVSHVLACVFFFQPLNWVARRRLREISEMLSDEWAVSRTGRPLSLAGCLAEVAGWSVPYRPLPVPGMADRPSNLAHRIRRLLDEGRSPERPARRFWLGAAMVALLVLVVAAAPVVSAARTESPASPDAPAEVAAALPTTAVLGAWVDVQDPSAPSALEEDDESDADQDDDADYDEDSDEDSDVDDEDSDEDLDFDFDFEFEDDFDFELGEDFEAEIDRIADSVSASMDAAMDALDLDLESLEELEDLGDLHSLSEEEQEKLERDINRSVREMNEKMRPHIEKLSREMADRASRHAMDAETQRLIQEMSRLASQMRPSEESMARLHAEMEKLRADGKLSAEEREKMAQEARRMAESMRPTEEQRRQLQAMREELRRHQRERAQSFRAENHEEMERAAREMRQAVEQEMKAVREEIRRSMEQRRVIQREQRKVIEQERRREMERKREERRERERQRESEKPGGGI